MNRDEALEGLVNLSGKWGELITVGSWVFDGNDYVNYEHGALPITIDDWNRAKIKPNTKIKIESTEHSQYVQKLAFENGFGWFSSGTGFKHEDAPFLVADNNKNISYINDEDYFKGHKYKEIFIEMPEFSKGGKHSYITIKKDEYEKIAESINARVLAEKVGSKHDQGKPRYDLVPVHAEAEFVDVLTFGATKYAPNQWRNVPDAKDRYTAAVLRHIAAYRMGETHDPESGKHHLAHAMCCLAFITELDLEDNQ